MNKLNLTDDDIKRAWNLYNEEKIEPLTSESMFRGIIYVMLSPLENFQKHIEIYNRLLTKGFDNPENIRKDRDGLMNIIKKSRYPNQKEKNIYNLALIWSESGLPSRILKDKNKENGFEIMKEFVKKVGGMGYKCTSLFLKMCDYLDLVTIDMWRLRWLGRLGLVNLTESDVKRGINDKNYLEYENLFVQLAKERGVKPAIYEMAVYSKFSNWRNGVQLEMI